MKPFYISYYAHTNKMKLKNNDTLDFKYVVKIFEFLL